MLEISLSALNAHGRHPMVKHDLKARQAPPLAAIAILSGLFSSLRCNAGVRGNILTEVLWPAAALVVMDIVLQTHSKTKVRGRSSNEDYGTEVQSLSMCAAGLISDQLM